MDGILEQTKAGPRLRFTRQLDHPLDKVWRAVTEPEHLKAWFPDTIVVEEWAVGAPLRFADTVVGDFGGEVLAFEPPTLLEFRWGNDVLRIELEGSADGTTLTLFDTIETIGKAARDGAGWHVCLDLLEHHLDGASPEWSPDNRWREVHPSYVERLGPAASTIGPPSGSLG